MSQLQRPKSKLASVISGSASGAVVSACVQPLDVLRTRMQVPPLPACALACLWGCAALLGLVPTLWRCGMACLPRPTACMAAEQASGVQMVVPTAR